MNRRWDSANFLGTAALTASLVLAHGAMADVADDIALDTITITTTKTEEKVIDTMAGASVVTSTDLERYQPSRLSDVLNAVPGVSVQEDSDDPASVINIRGLQDFGRVNVMIEGARQNFQRSGHGGNGQVYIEPELIGSVDITRGPVSTIYGSGAIGGVVNFKLIDPADFIEPDETWALTQKLSFDTNRDGILSSTTVAARPIDSVGFLGNFVFRDDGNYTDGRGDEVLFTAKEVVSGLAKATFQLTKESSLVTTYLKQNFDYNTGAGGGERDTTTEDETFVAKFRHISADNPLLDFTMSAYHTTTNTDQLRLNGRLIGNERSFQITTVGTDIFNTSRFNTRNLQHELTYGADIFRDRVRTTDPGGNGDEFTPSGERIAYGTFIQDEIQYSSWFDLIVALRYDGYSLEGGSVDSDGDRLSPKATLGLTPVEGLQFYGTYAEGYRAPSITETLIEGVHPGGFAFPLLPNPNLVPETARTYEVGVNLSRNGLLRENDRFRAKANYFHNNVEDFIGSVYRRCGAGGACPFGDFQYLNISEAELYGIELEAEYDFRRGFIQASYTNTTGNNLTDNQPLSSIYPDKFVGTVGLRFFDNALTTGARWTAVAAQDRVPTGSPTSDSYNLYDVFATYEHSRRFSTALTLKNITDVEYVPYRQAENTPSPGFSAILSATIKFGG